MNECISIIYFSGTGGVRRIAHEFERQFKEQLFSLYVCELDSSRHAIHYDEIDDAIRESRYVFLLFPVHAFDAPRSHISLD
jgi:flavodoxin